MYEIFDTLKLLQPQVEARFDLLLRKLMSLNTVVHVYERLYGQH